MLSVSFPLEFSKRTFFFSDWNWTDMGWMGLGEDEEEALDERKKKKKKKAIFFPP